MLFRTVCIVFSCVKYITDKVQGVKKSSVSNCHEMYSPFLSEREGKKKKRKSAVLSVTIQEWY